MPSATEIFWEEVTAIGIWTPCKPVHADHPEWRRILPADQDDVAPPSPEAQLAAKLGGEALDAWMKENAD